MGILALIHTFFNLSDGNKAYVENSNNSNDIDTIIFGEGLSFSDMTITKDVINSDIVLSFTSGDSIRLKGFLFADNELHNHKIEKTTVY